MIDKVANLTNAKTLLEERWGKFVYNYIEVERGDYVNGWKWKSLDNINILSKEREELIRILSSRNITFQLG